MSAVKVSGFKALEQTLKGIRQQAEANALVGPELLMAGEFVMTEAKKDTPVEFGTLRNSGRVDLKIDGRRATVTLGFYTDYAIYVHENLRARHPIGRAKFLERAVNRNKRNIEKIVARGMAERMTQ